jgi:uncharacterized protein (DUF486 family)
MDGSREGGSRFSASAALVPLMLLTSSLVMALAWLGHLRFKGELSLLAATSLAWLLVLPEYALNIKALRMGYGIYLAAQMAAFRLCAGVVWVAIVSRYVLGEALTSRKLIGFGVMMVAMILVGSKRPTGVDEANGASH